MGRGQKNGKTTATVLFPGSNPDAGTQADYAVYYGETWAESSLDKLQFKKAESWKHTESSFSPLKEAILKLPLKKAKNKEIYILALDTSDDGKTNYNRFIFSENRSADPKDVTVNANEWGAIPVEADGESAGFWFKLKMDPGLEKASIYRTAVTSALIEGPDGFEEELLSEFGFFQFRMIQRHSKKSGLLEKSTKKSVHVLSVGQLMCLCILKKNTSRIC